jgi:cysteine-S-conjugate beta-lyase
MTYDFDRLVDRRRSDSSKWGKYGPDVLPLWVADMDFQSPEPVIRALRERVEHGFFGYIALEQPEFHELFADRLHKRYGWRVSPEAIVIIPGVIPGFNVAGRVFAAPGDGLILQTPVYPPILRAAGNMGLTREEAPLALRTGAGQTGRSYEVDVDAFEAAIGERTRFFLLCNPHNPVGRVFRRDELEGLAAACLRHGLTIVADEIHCELIYSGHRHTPIASLSPEIAERTITFMAPSKTFNLAGLKCSVAIIPNGALREKFIAGRADLVSTVNVFGYTAAFAAYRDGQAWLDALLRYLEANRDFAVDYVRTRLPGVSVATPEATYLGWLDCRNAGPAAADPFTFFLEKARVALNDGTLFGPGGEGFVRLNFGCPRPLLAEALDRMREALTGDRRAPA